MQIPSLKLGLVPAARGASAPAAGPLPGTPSLPNPPTLPPIVALPPLPGGDPGGPPSDPGNGPKTPPGGSAGGGQGNGQGGSVQHGRPNGPRPVDRPGGNNNVSPPHEVEADKVDIDMAREAALATLRKERFRLMLEKIADSRSAEIISLMRPEKSTEGFTAVTAEYSDNGAVVAGPAAVAAHKPAQAGSSAHGNK